MAKATGGGGSFTVNGVSIPFLTVEPTVTKDMDDATDSTNFDITSGIVHKSQLAVATQTTFAVEGKIDLTIHPTSLAAACYASPTAVACIVKYNATSTFGHGLVDITEFKATIDPMKVLNYTATLITNGVFTPNA
jgi:hypothetical protein